MPILILKKKIFLYFVLAFLCCPLSAGLRPILDNRFGEFLDTKYTFVFIFVKKMAKKRFDFTKKSKYR